MCILLARWPWRWARSLPWSAADRVQDDALWLAVHAVPMLACFGALLSGSAALLTVPVVPLLAVRAAGALRAPHRTARPFARVLGEGAFVAGCLSVTLWTVLPAMLLVWPAWREAATRDRNLEVSRWSPQAHLASGDPVSWRGA